MRLPSCFRRTHQRAASSLISTLPFGTTQRHAHTPSSPPSSPPKTSVGAETDNVSTSTHLVKEDSEDWVLSHVHRSVECGRQTPEAADYFRSIMHDQPEFRQCLHEARRLMGGQNPDQLTHYQQGQFADRLCNYMSGIASDKLRRAHAEEQNTKRYTQDGTPTGENYWFEAGNALSSSDVPGYMKDAILKEMQEERGKASPAFQHPPEEEAMAAEDEKYAAHLRRQRNKLLRDTDFS